MPFSAVNTQKKQSTHALTPSLRPESQPTQSTQPSQPAQSTRPAAGPSWAEFFSDVEPLSSTAPG